MADRHVLSGRGASKRRNTIPIERLRELIEIAPPPAFLRWKVARKGRWGIKPGTPALTAINERWGYAVGTVDCVHLRRARVVFALHHGRWPGALVDHIDGDTLNDRPENLREATYAENGRNRRSAKGSSSVYLGVSWVSREKRWQSSIKVGESVRSIGLFNDEIAAALSYDAEATKHFGEFARTNFTLDRTAPTVTQAMADEGARILRRTCGVSPGDVARVVAIEMFEAMLRADRAKALSEMAELDAKMGLI